MNKIVYADRPQEQFLQAVFLVEQSPAFPVFFTTSLANKLLSSILAPYSRFKKGLALGSTLTTWSKADFPKALAGC